MSIYYPEGCEDEIPDHQCDECETLENAKVRSVAYIRSTFSFADETSPTEWAAGIDNRDIIIIPKVQGSFDGGAPVEGTGYGDQATRLTGYNFSLVYKDPNYKNNCDFYNAIKRSRSYKIAYRTSTQTHISDTTVSIIPKNPVVDDQSADVVWDVEVKWSAGDLPCPFDTPAGIFDQCLAVTP